MFIVTIIAAVLHVLCHVSIDHCVFLLHGISAVLTLAFPHDQSSFDISKDVRSVFTSLDLHPPSKGYCCCPNCFCCYPLEEFPDRCTNKATIDSEPCGRTLRKTKFVDGRVRSHAARRYLYHDMKAWLGRMLCRPGMEEHLDRDVFDTGSSPGEMRDIWDGRALKTFCWTDGKRFVGSGKKDEGRYVFALNMDGFNPFGNKHGGATASTGALYMVCLNLPPHLRHRVENIFLVSIIPGPHEPSLVEINELIRPLVDDLLCFWKKGVYYTRTYKYDRRRLVRCALVPVICDLPAARQMMAFASHSSRHFCCYCGLQSEDMENLDVEKWPPGVSSREEYVEIAERWKAAPAKVQKTLFEQHGIRYSELLRLPYWDPTSYVVIDSMHGILLGLLRHHCRVLWEMNIQVADGDGTTRTKPTKRDGPTPEKMDEGWDILHRGTTNDMKTLNLGVLEEMCIQSDIPIGGHKTQLREALQELVRLSQLSILVRTKRILQSDG